MLMRILSGDFVRQIRFGEDRFYNKQTATSKFFSRVAFERKMHRLSYARNDSRQQFWLGKFYTRLPGVSSNTGRSSQLPVHLVLKYFAELRNSRIARTRLSRRSRAFSPSYFPTYFIFPGAYTIPSSP